MDLCDVRVIKPLLQRYGFQFRRAMGQNFLIDGAVPQKIAALSGADKRCGVLEIGSGIGTLTQRLCERAGRVVAVELDKALLPVLAETVGAADNLTLLQGDILKMDITPLVQTYFPGLTPMVCANLPYNITTPVLTALVESRQFASLTVMVQREVARRIAAAPGTGEYGAFSVYMQYHTEPSLVLEVSPESFMPAPQVWSAVVRCRVRDVPAVSPRCGEAFFFRTVRGAFAQRRKTLANSLTSAFSGTLDKKTIAGILTACGLPDGIRGERLGLEEFSRLSEALWEAMAVPDG